MAHTLGALVASQPVSVLGGVSILVLVILYAVRYLKPSYTKPVVSKTTPFLLDFPPPRPDTKVEVPALTLYHRHLPSTESVNLNKTSYTPTGWSTKEIKALGRFPDYAKLTGVRHPEPVSPNFDIHKATFRPFRPFRWRYHQNMSIMKYEPDFWVELERNYFSQMAQRKEVYEKNGDRVLFSRPGSELACRELMEMLLQYCCKRYPQLFSLEKDNTVFKNRLLNTETDLLTTDPLRVISQNLSEDYAIMMRNEKDGFYYLRAANVVSSVGWDIAQHTDREMFSIHKHVPDSEQMTHSINRFFSKMPTEKPIQRGSWGIEDWEVLFSSPEVVKNWTRSAFQDNPQDRKPENLRLRLDWQTLRRLPLSGAIVFNFKAIFFPLEDLRDEPFVPALLYRILHSGKENLIEYKCLPEVRDLALAELEKWKQEQVEQGVVPADWEEHTLEESPFFPRWKEKWSRLQGF